MSSNNNYIIANAGMSLNLFSNTYRLPFHVYTRSRTILMDLEFCKICNMYKCFHKEPVTPHILHHSQCACIQRNAGNY